MKLAFLFLVVSILLALMFLSSAEFYPAETTFNVHFHDTYFIILKEYVYISAFLIFGTIFSLGGAIGTRFRKAGFLISLGLFVIADLLVVGWCFRQFSS